MTINYNVDIRKHLHYTIFTKMNEIRSWGLSKNDLKVFAAFYNKDFDLLSKIPDYDARMLVLFSKETKDIIIDNIKVSYNTFNNSLSKLRKKGLIKGNSLLEQLLFDLDSKEFKIILKLKHEEQEVSRVTKRT